tara:strand:+ start:1329 stop:2363 length:1035 start_codon:yes stop_codon:yes gene_type:complete
MKIFITGAAGFIGFHLCKRFIKEGINVIGIDNFNKYYDVNLKKSRIRELNNLSKQCHDCFEFYNGDLLKSEDLEEVFNDAYKKKSKITEVIHLAAQAGVRYSFENPSSYIQSNLVGFFNIIEKSKENEINHFYYASSSSVYGGNDKLPFKESDNVDKPVSLYAATKKSNELIAHTYSHLFSLPTTGLRFFTVYGPWGRPDMALFKFTDSIIKNKPIRVFNYGNMLRDFTYIDDVIESIFYLIQKTNSDKNNQSNKSNNIKDSENYRIFNVGNSNPVKLYDYIKAIEINLNKKAEMILEEMQPGDVESTYADTELLEKYINFKPSTSIDIGIKEFINWYLDYFKK